MSAALIPNNPNFLSQRISAKEKTKEWHSQVCDSKIHLSQTMTNQRMDYDDMVMCYELLSGKIKWEDFRKVTDAYGVRNTVGEMPAKLRDFNLVGKKVETLIGEEMSRPWACHVGVVGGEGFREIDEMSRQQTEAMVMELMQKYFGSEGASPQDAQGMAQETMRMQNLVPKEMSIEDLPDSVQRWLKQSAVSRQEEVLNKILFFLRQKLKLDDLASQGFFHGLAVSEEIYHISMKNGKPYVRVVNPLASSFVRTSDSDAVSTFEEFSEFRQMTQSQILDEFGAFLTDEETKRIADMNIGTGYTNQALDDLYFWNRNASEQQGFQNYDQHKVNVWHVTWKSWKKVIRVSWLDADGQVQEFLASEEAAKNGIPLKEKGIKVHTEWVPETRKCTKIGSDIYIDYGLVEWCQGMAQDGISSRLPYCGHIYSFAHQKPRSLVFKLREYQYFAILILFQIEKQVNTMKGSKLVFNPNMRPKNMTVEQWSYFMDALDIIYIDPNATIDMEGQGEREHPAVSVSQATAQVTSIDLSKSRHLMDLFQSLDYFQRMIDDLSGVAAVREGQTVGGDKTAQEVNATVSGSIASTAYLFKFHSLARKDLLENVIEAAKYHWHEKPIHERFLSDQEKIEIRANPMSLLDTSTAVYLSDDIMETVRMRSIQNAANTSVSQGNLSTLEFAEVQNAKSAAEMVSRLQHYEDKRNAKEQQQQQAQIDSQNANVEKVEANKKQMHEDEQRTKIIVAAIGAAGGKGVVGSNEVTGIVDDAFNKYAQLKEIENNEKKVDADINDKREKTQQAQQKLEFDNRKLNSEEQRFNREQDQQDKHHADEMRIKAKKASTN